MCMNCQKSGTGRGMSHGGPKRESYTPGNTGKAKTGPARTRGASTFGTPKIRMNFGRKK